MRLVFPSREFDDAVAAVCHGTASDEQMIAVRDLLLGDPAARDEYLRRVAVHAYLASHPDLFAGSPADVATLPQASCPTWRTGSSAMPTRVNRVLRMDRPWALAWAAGLVALLGVAAWFGFRAGAFRRGETSRAVAMLNRVVNARWSDSDRLLRLGAPLEPGRLRLESGLAQIVFYNGARVVIEGPAEVQLISSTEAACLQGKLTAEVPPQAKGFRVVAPRLDVTDLGTAFGLKVAGDRSELHVFEGRVECQTAETSSRQDLTEGKGMLVEGAGVMKSIAANRAEFAELFDLQARSVAAEARRYDQWRESSRRLRRDPSLWVHLDFEHGGASDWRLPNLGSLAALVPDATVVGCEWREGRWATKPALEFRGISDRVRLDVPEALESVTLAAWVRVQGLDREINSLFMSDGFLPGTLHWVIRNDGVLGLTVIGEKRGHQIVASPSVLTIDQFGIWTHLAVVLDAGARQVVHYLNGRAVSQHGLRVSPPFRVGAAELGNWKAQGFPGNDPFLIRNFSGAIDEFCLFSRALSADEIRRLHSDGRPQAEGSIALHRGSAPAFDLTSSTSTQATP